MQTNHANKSGAEKTRLQEDREGRAAWKKWGPYLSERQWGTVREDYSSNGDAWNYFTHDNAQYRACRWGEDGLAGINLSCAATSAWRCATWWWPGRCSTAPWPGIWAANCRCSNQTSHSNTAIPQNVSGHRIETPVVTGADGSDRPGGAGWGCAAGASAGR